MLTFPCLTQCPALLSLLCQTGINLFSEVFSNWKLETVDIWLTEAHEFTYQRDHAISHSALPC